MSDLTNRLFRRIGAPNGIFRKFRREWLPASTIWSILTHSGNRQA